MSWYPARRNPVERDVRIETHGSMFRLELLRGGKLYATRNEKSASAAVKLAHQWLLLGPAILVLERIEVCAA